MHCLSNLMDFVQAPEMRSRIWHCSGLGCLTCVRSFQHFRWLGEAFWNWSDFCFLWMIRPYVFLFRWRHVHKNRSRSERFVSLKWWEINSDSSSTNLITFCTHSDCLWHSRLWGELPTKHHRHTAWSGFFNKIWGYTYPSVYNHIHKYTYVHTWLYGSHVIAYFYSCSLFGFVQISSQACSNQFLCLLCLWSLQGAVISVSVMRHDSRNM